MIAGKTKHARTAAMALAVAAAFTVVVPGTALVIDHIQCVGGIDDFLKIWTHLSGRDSVDCHAIAHRGAPQFSPDDVAQIGP